MHKLQVFVLPRIDIISTEDMYFHGSDDTVIASLKNQKISIEKSKAVQFDTFFNSFSVEPWKKNCSINDLNIAITGKGHVRIRFGLHTLNEAHRWLYECDVNLSEAPLEIELPFWAHLERGMLYLEMRALSYAEFTGGYFFTRTPPRNDVKLGIVITHFNRKKYVLPAIKRISDELLNEKYCDDRISLVVVDNSQNIEDDEKRKAILIPSINLGGSGGFTKGFLYLKDNGYSHCLFMDDDASCEMESIRRTLQLLQYAKINKMAIAGAMMREAEPFRLHEKGARIDDGKGVVNLKHGLDIRHVHDLLLAEEDEPVTYGGWWHFAFGINDVQHLSFPFFVRGDDMLFGATNNFNIVTMNGIGGWADDFGLKENPTNRYLSLRAHIMCLILNTNTSKWKMLKTYFGCVITSDMSYNFSGARAFTEAMRDVMRGPSFWEENISMEAVRKKLAQIAPGEKCEPIEIPQDIDRHRSLHESKLRRWVRLLTLNGIFLPDFLLKNRTVVEPKNYHAVFRRIFRYRRVMYLAPDRTGYIVEYNRKKFFGNLKEFFETSVKFYKEFDSLKKTYRKSFDYLTSEKFWRKIFSETQKS
ncbi:glycosyltransferase family 2 protein [Acetobacter sp.]|uniref:glycosyltransferase family 2 protein n=1 Tax=Acetobacter sp. TaxID=440 RepID=UPI0039ED149C